LSRVDLPHLARAGTARVQHARRTFRAPVDELGSVTMPAMVRLSAGKSLVIRAKR